MKYQQFLERVNYFGDQSINEIWWLHPDNQIVAAIEVEKEHPIYFPNKVDYVGGEGLLYRVEANYYQAEELKEGLNVDISNYILNNALKVQKANNQAIGLEATRNNLIAMFVQKLPFKLKEVQSYNGNQIVISQIEFIELPRIDPK